MDTATVNKLKMMVDEFEDRARDKNLMPMERYVWRKASKELAEALKDA